MITTKKPNWKNLKKNKCPFCSHDLDGNAGQQIFCVKCDFKIGIQKFTAIINDQVNTDLLSQNDFQI